LTNHYWWAQYRRTGTKAESSVLTFADRQRPPVAVDVGDGAMTHPSPGDTFRQAEWQVNPGALQLGAVGPADDGYDLDRGGELISLEEKAIATLRELAAVTHPAATSSRRTRLERNQIRRLARLIQAVNSDRTSTLKRRQAELETPARHLRMLAAPSMTT
jgi:hypothetical protein